MAELTSSAASTSRNNKDYEVFISYVEKPFATDLYYRLREHNLRVFPDFEELQNGKNTIDEIDSAILTASVHIAVFSGGYAKSSQFLNELLLMLKSQATIIPVLYGVDLSQLQRTQEHDPGLYAEALRTMKTQERVNSELIDKWRTALDHVSQRKERLELESYNGCEALLVNAIVEKVERNICHVFINRGPDVLKTFASHLYHRLQFHIEKRRVFKEELRREDRTRIEKRRVFMDKEELPREDRTPQLKEDIKKSSVRIAIFSKNYAESSSCLNELVSIFNEKFESKGIIIPVFYGVKPSELRWQTGVFSKLRWQNGGLYDLFVRMVRKTRNENGDGTQARDTVGVFSKLWWQNGGVYDLFVRMLRKTRNENGDGTQARDTVDSDSRKNWKMALSNVAKISGFERAECNGDDGLLVNKIVQRVLSSDTSIKYDVFISHRGPDCKKTLASHLYHGLVALGLRPFLDKEELEKGKKFTTQIHAAIKSASVHIAIFSPNYGDSVWCMIELAAMCDTEKTIIPVFYNVDKSYFMKKCQDGEGEYAGALHSLKSKSERDGIFHWTPRHNFQNIKKWSEAIFNVAGKSDSFNLKDYDGDEGVLLDKVVHSVAKLVSSESDGQRSNSNWIRSQTY